MLVILSQLVSADLTPPEQQYYLHFAQRADFCCGDGLTSAPHQTAWVHGDQHQVEIELSIAVWVYWESSDLEEISAASGLDVDRMSMICGQHAYGFQRGSYGSEGWTFFLQNNNESVYESGEIPIPLEEWAHLAATYDGSTIRTYLNGVQQAELTITEGDIPVSGDAFPELCDYPGSDTAPEGPLFGIGRGTGFTGGLRQLSLWNRTLSAAEITEVAERHLSGTEPGLISYWPMSEIGEPWGGISRAKNLGPGEGGDGRDLILFSHEPWGDYLSAPSWRLMDPMFEVREDLVEDVVSTGCASLDAFGWAWVDIDNDRDKDLVFSGASKSAPCGGGLTPVRVLRRDGPAGFVYDPAAIVGGAMANGNIRSHSADFNGDHMPDVIIGNIGTDYCDDDAGAPNNLLLSRPDGLLEEATVNILAPPCDQSTPQFVGQHVCHHGGDYGGRAPGVRYPGSGQPVPPHPAVSHSVTAGDIDGDGDIDILVGNVPFNALETPYVLINDGLGHFLADWQKLPDVMYNLRTGIHHFLLEDMDGDGFPDLVTGPITHPIENSAPPQWGEHFGGIYWNDGSGRFSEQNVLNTPVPEGLGTHPEGHPVDASENLATDIDRDGDMDLIIAWGGPGGVDGRVTYQVLVNNGGRVFLDETNERVGKPPQMDNSWNVWVPYLSAGDFNGDGCPDLMHPDNAYPWLPYDSSGFYLNDCQGYFKPIKDRVRPKRITYAIPFDYDEDGDMDILSWQKHLINLSTNDSCADGEGTIADYMDFAVWLNQSPSSFQINAGHAGAWYNPDTPGQGQLIGVEPASKFLFLAWFAFTDAASDNRNEQHWFTAQGNYNGNTAALTVYETLDGSFDDSQPVSTDPVGSATLIFDNCDRGRMNYSIDSWDLQGSIQLQRAIPGTENVCNEQVKGSTESLDLNDGRDGAWYDETTPGQGFLIDAHPNPEGDDFIFVAWFTYGADTVSGQRWLTAQGSFESSIAEIPVYETTGGSFDSPIATETESVGSLLIDFTDCSNATLTYLLTDESLSGGIDIKRAIPGTEALCEELAGAD